MYSDSLKPVKYEIPKMSAYDLIEKIVDETKSKWEIKNDQIHISTTNPYYDHKLMLDKKFGVKNLEKEQKMAVPVTTNNVHDLQKFRVMEAILKDFCINYGIGFDMEFKESTYINYFIGEFKYDGKNAKRWEIKLSALDDVEDAERKAKEIIRILRNIFALGGTFSSKYKNYSKASTDKRRIPKIERVIFNDPATIVFWKDGTKTVVRAFGGDEFDPEKGLAMAFSKKALGNDYEYYNEFLKQLKKVKED